MENCNSFLLTNGKDLSSDLMSYSKICENIRHAMSEIIQLKTSTSKINDKKTDVTELRMQGSFDFLNLKQLNRAAQIQCKHVKDKTLESKQKLDGYNLQLENLQYEISHLHKEITKCLEFRSRHDDISLISVEDFYKLAPPEISVPESTKQDVHKQTLARLDFELEQRKDLASNLQELKNKRESVTENISGKKQNLQTLAPALQNLLKASLPLQETFNIPFDHLRNQHDLARLLPRPLFVLFLQTSGYREACDSLLSVSIDGDADAARKIQEVALESGNVRGVTQDGNDSESDQDDGDDQDSGRRHKRKKTKETSMDVDDLNSSDDSFVPYPLNVTLFLTIRKNGPKLELKFFYFNKLNIITVRGRLDNNADSSVNDSSLLNVDTLLCCIFDNDYGLKSPNPSTPYLLQKSASKLSDLCLSYGRPFLWAQNLCGLMFMSNEKSKLGEDMQISFNHIQGIIKALRKRITSRVSLSQQIEQFALKMVVYKGSDAIEIPSKIHSNLSSWSEILLSDYVKLPHTSGIVELGLLGSEEEAACHRYFLATVKRGATVTVEVAVVVYCDYPVTTPLLAVALKWRGIKTSSNDHNVQEMETELNVRSSMTHKNNHILTSQLLKLMTMIDLYVETESDTDNASQPVEFNLSKLCPHKARGPARLKPFVYEAASKTFIHRGYENS